MSILVFLPVLAESLCFGLLMVLIMTSVYQTGRLKESFNERSDTVNTKLDTLTARLNVVSAMAQDPFKLKPYKTWFKDTCDCGHCLAGISLPCNRSSSSAPQMGAPSQQVTQFSHDTQPRAALQADQHTQQDPAQEPNDRLPQGTQDSHLSGEDLVPLPAPTQTQAPQQMSDQALNNHQGKDRVRKVPSCRVVPTNQSGLKTALNRSSSSRSF